MDGCTAFPVLVSMQCRLIGIQSGVANRQTQGLNVSTVFDFVGKVGHCPQTIPHQDAAKMTRLSKVAL